MGPGQRCGWVSGSTRLAPAKPTQIVHHQTPEQLMKLEYMTTRRRELG